MPPSKEAPAAIVWAAERTDVPEEAGMSPPEVTVPLPVLGADVVIAPPPELEVADALDAFELVVDEAEPEFEPDESGVLEGAFAVVLLSAPVPEPEESEVLDAFAFVVVEEAASATEEVFDDFAFALMLALKVVLAVGLRALSVSLKPGKSSSQSRAAISRLC